MSENETTELLNAWQSNISDAMKKVHERFCGNTKIILTESDLKCWLFYELQNQNPHIPYAVHTEVTHYAQHTNKKAKLEKKYKFRDLSLLCPLLIRDNEKIWEETSKEILYNKGFKHNGPAIHFELKYIRQGNNLNSLESDITKLNEYYPNPETAERKFIVVWGSRCSTNNLGILKTKLYNTIIQLSRNHNLIEFYLFDSKEIAHIKWNGQEWI